MDFLRLHLLTRDLQKNDMVGFGRSWFGTRESELSFRFLAAEQLRQLNEMGFYDPQENIRALTMTGGHVEGAIEFVGFRKRSAAKEPNESDVFSVLQLFRGR